MSAAQSVAQSNHSAKFILLLGLLTAFGPLAIDMYLPAFPDLSEDFGASASSVQLTLTACLLGLALGQLVVGPISDARGRRLPLLVGLAGFAVTSLLCVMAPSIWTLVALRFAQGLCGAAGLVISRAVARDLYRGHDLARFFATLMLVNGVSPILAPVVGSEILRFLPWQGVFVVLSSAGVLLFFACLFGLRETLPAERRQPGELRSSLRMFRSLLSDRTFMGYALASAFGTAAVFAYVSGSSFVLQDVYGLSPSFYGVVFGVNGAAMVMAAQISSRLVRRVSAERLLSFGLCGIAAGGLTLLVSVAFGLGLPGVLAAFALTLFSVGFVGPNAAAQALDTHGESAGTASALLGVLGFGMGAAFAPLVGIAGPDTAVPMALAMAGLGVTAVLVRVLLAPTGAARPRWLTTRNRFEGEPDAA